MSTSPSEGLFVAVTCDGNRRYEVDHIREEEGRPVTKKELSPEELYLCYKAGGDAMKKIIETSRDQSVGIIAAWAWSRNNWKRSLAEQKAVFQVTREFLKDLQENWIDLPENKDVRLVHMGRRAKLRQADSTMMAMLEDLSEYTRQRAGMVVALCLDYSGPDEMERAEHQLITKKQGRLRDYLDLPRQGVPFKEVDLRVRTGEDERATHINAYLQGYEGDRTREIARKDYLPDYTQSLFLDDLSAFHGTEKREGV